ncbi:hypothetical protein GCM10009830_09570 [Glycomyces endophyticus]|uniref:Uncharacterized protein n=1 Tax=Glycomyces endophyticus TaxID=480996 RepID=A0ABP4S1Q5_9ACTN
MWHTRGVYAPVTTPPPGVTVEVTVESFGYPRGPVLAMPARCGERSSERSSGLRSVAGPVPASGMGPSAAGRPQLTGVRRAARGPLDEDPAARREPNRPLKGGAPP